MIAIEMLRSGRREAAARIWKTNRSDDGVEPISTKVVLIQTPAQGQSGVTGERASTTGGRRTGFDGVSKGGGTE
jgi:hypothetical protein